MDHALYPDKMTHVHVDITLPCNQVLLNENVI